jgi:hypothetical protein
MSASAIFTEVQSVLATAIPEALVVPGVPKSWNANILIYLYHDGSTDAAKAGPSVIRRTHVIPIHLAILSTGDDMQAEAVLLDLHDRITNTFYTNRFLNATASTSQLYQRDGKQGGTGPQYILNNNSEYRHRWWTLEAAEDLTFTFA